MPELKSFLGSLYLGAWTIVPRFGLSNDGQTTARTNQADRPGGRTRILVVVPFAIHPVIHGAAARISNLIRRMARTSDVSLMVLGGCTDDPEHRRAYEDCCERVVFHRLPDHLEAQVDPWGLMPPSSRPFSHPSVTDRISALVSAHAIDIVQLECAELGAHVRRADDAQTVLVEHDLGFRTQARQRALNIGQRFGATRSVGAGVVDGLRQRRFEIIACEAADQVHCMSDDDREVLAGRLKKRAHLRVVPNGVDIKTYRPGPTETRRGVLFLGSFPHLPNLDAFEYLVEVIWPAIRRRRPDAVLTVAGARPPRQVVDWDGRDGIHVVGEVDDVGPLYRDHRVLVVPLRAGSGTRLKILEALASGLPVVSTTIGAEGLDMGDPPELAIADNPEALAAEVVSILDADDETVVAISRRGRSLVEAIFDWDVIARGLQRAHADIRSADRREERPVDPTMDQPPRNEDPEISVIIPTCGGIGPNEGLMDGLARQDVHGDFEVICVDSDSPQETRQRWRDSGLNVIPARGSAFNQGEALNTGAAAARGRILVLTTVDAIPADARWLAQLVAPFDHDNSPAAVQGGITAQLVDGGQAHRATFTQESERWREAHGGLEFSAVNAAMPRKIWEHYPFPPRALLADRAWQRIASDHELLILPCLAAAVRQVRQRTAVGLLRAWIEEGRAWRNIGVRYTLPECWADAVHALPLVGDNGEPAPAAGRCHTLFRVGRPIGILLGNRLTTT